MFANVVYSTKPLDFVLPAQRVLGVFGSYSEKPDRKRLFWGERVPPLHNNLFQRLQSVTICLNLGPASNIFSYYHFSCHGNLNLSVVSTESNSTRVTTRKDKRTASQHFLTTYRWMRYYGSSAPPTIGTRLRTTLSARLNLAQ